MELKKHTLVIVKTPSGEPGVMMYNRSYGNFVDDFYNTRKTSNHTPYDIFILSYEPINDGDWFYDYYTHDVEIADENTDKTRYGRYKVVATTSKEVTGLPGISNEFVLKYIEQDNKGDIIEKVMLEYEHIGNQSYEIEEGKTDDYPIYDLKINEDNTVNIYLVEAKVEQ